MNAAVADVTFHVEHSERDLRTMNNMDTGTKRVHLRLEAWGRWSKDCEMTAFPSVTLLGRVIEQGISGAGQQGRPPITMPDHIAAIDAAICKLCEIDRRAIKAYYLRERSREECARDLKMRVRQFQNVLRRARWRIEGHLSAMER